MVCYASPKEQKSKSESHFVNLACHSWHHYWRIILSEHLLGSQQMEGNLMQLAWKLHEFNIFECGLYKMIYDWISDSIRSMMWYEMTETPGIVSWMSGKIQAGFVYFFHLKVTLEYPRDATGAQQIVGHYMLPTGSWYVMMGLVKMTKVGHIPKMLLSLAAIATLR